MSSTRVEYLDAIKGFAIFLVIYGHCVQHLLIGDPYNNYVYLGIYSFHMPLFMIMSGLFAESALKKPFIDLFKNKFTNLLLPCISWGTLLIFLRFFVINPENTWKQVLLNDFWFLKSLFCCFILTKLLLPPPPVGYVTN